MSEEEPRAGARAKALSRGKRSSKKQWHKKSNQKSHKKKYKKKQSQRKKSGKKSASKMHEAISTPKKAPDRQLEPVPDPEPEPKPEPKPEPPPVPVAELPAPAPAPATNRQQVVAELLGALGAPYVAWQVATALWQTTADEDDDKPQVLSLGGGVNGWMAAFTRARWMRRTGFFGVATSCYLGHAGALVSPPGGPWLVSRLGLRNTTLLVLSMMALGLALLGVFQLNLSPLVLAPFALGSRALLDPLLRTGRVETLAWGLVVLAAGALALGFNMVVALLVGVALCIAPLPATVGALGLLGCLFQERGVTFGVVEYLLVVVPVAVLWWWPFLAHGREKVGFETADAAAAPDWQVARIQALEQRVRALVGPAAALLLAALFLGAAGFAVLGLAVVVAAGLWILQRERFLLHPSTFDLAVLVTGLLAVGWSSGILTPIVFLVVLWFLHGVESPGLQDAPGQVRPLRFESQLQSIRSLVAQLPDTSRVAVEFKGWQPGLNRLLAHALADRDDVELLSGVDRYEVAPEVPDGYERHMNLEDGAEVLLERMERVGAQYLISQGKELSRGLERAGFRELRVVEMAGFEPDGPFREGETIVLRLLEAPGAMARISPAVGIEKKPNQLAFAAKGGQRYLLKYSHYRGWKATDAEGRELLVEDALPGMWITVPQDTTVRVRYIWRSYYGR